MQLPDQMNTSEGGVSELKLLKNPLPQPPRRSHVRMEFDVETKDQDEFDIDIPEDDDFDI